MKTLIIYYIRPAYCEEPFIDDEGRQVDRMAQVTIEGNDVDAWIESNYDGEFMYGLQSFTYIT